MLRSNPMIKRFKQRVALVQADANVNLWIPVSLFGFSELAYIFLHIEQLERQWNGILRVPVVVFAITGFLNIALLGLFILSLGESNWARSIERILFLGAANLLFEFMGLILCGLCISNYVGWSQDILILTILQVADVFHTLLVMQRLRSLMQISW